MQDESSDPFYGIMIEDSFVFGWSLEGKALEVQLLLSIWPSSKHYESPKQGEWTCYKVATLKLRNMCKLENFVHMEDAMKTHDPDGSMDYGCFDSVSIQGDTITIHGPFGEATTKTNDLCYEFHESTKQGKAD